MFRPIRCDTRVIKRAHMTFAYLLQYKGTTLLCFPSQVIFK